MLSTKEHQRLESLRKFGLFRIFLLAGFLAFFVGCGNPASNVPEQENKLAGDDVASLEEILQLSPDQESTPGDDPVWWETVANQKVKNEGEIIEIIVSGDIETKEEYYGNTAYVRVEQHVVCEHEDRGRLLFNATEYDEVYLEEQAFYSVSFAANSIMQDCREIIAAGGKGIFSAKVYDEVTGELKAEAEDLLLLKNGFYDGDNVNISGIDISGSAPGTGSLPKPLL